MDLESDEMDWGCLPQDILIDVLRHMTLADRCQASVTCQRWREAFWAPKFWRNVVLDIKNRRDGDRANLLRRVIPYSRSVTIVWPHMGIKKRESNIDIRNKNTIVQLLESLQQNTMLEHLDLRFDNAFSVDSKFVQPVLESLSILLKNVNHLKYLCLGAHPLITPPNLSSLLASHQKRLDIIDLHVGTVQEMHSMKYRTSLKFEASAVILLANVAYLTLDWITVTAEFMEALNGIERPLTTQIKKLSLFLHPHQCNGDHPSKETWEDFTRRNPGVKVFLVFLHTMEEACICDHIRYIRGVSIVKNVECRTVAPSVYYRVMNWHQTTAEGHLAVNSKRPIELQSGIGAGMWDGTKACVNLKYLTFIGMYMYDEVLLFIAAHFGSQIEQLVVSKSDILTFAEATNFSIPVTASKLNALVRQMSRVLQKPWSPLNKVKLATLHFADGKDDDFFMTGRSSSAVMTA